MTAKSIHIGGVRVALLDYVVSCTAILGIRDSGKTVTAKGIAEQLLDYGIPIVVFDAVGKWRWLKVAGQQKGGQGYKVVVAGGRHPDLPLTTHSVAEIVRSSIREKIPLIIDLYDPKLSKADWRRIVQQSIRIIHYEADGLCHVFLEEAAEYVPQRVQDGETYAEVEKLARMGGNASVGITLINQRSQEVNKAVLDLSHNLILGCQIGNKAIEAVEKWVDRLAPETAKEVTTSLPQLQSGEAWVWTRSNPAEPHREKLPMCKSLHPDRRTPDVVLSSAKATDTDEFVQRLSASIPKVIEEQKANDPVELKRTIADLKRKMEIAGRSARLHPEPEATPSPIKVEVPMLDDAAKHLLEKIQIAYEATVQAETSRALHFQELQRQVNSLRGQIGVMVSNADKPALAASKPKFLRDIKRIIHHEPRQQSNGEAVSGGMRRMMIALAQRNGLTKKQLGVRAGLSSRSGTFGTYLGRLRSNRWIEGSAELKLTEDGFEALGKYDPLPEGEALLDYWLSDLGNSGAGRMLDVLAKNYPKGLTKQELGEMAEISHSSGTFGTYLGKLRTLELVEGRGEIRASAEFFE